MVRNLFVLATVYASTRAASENQVLALSFVKYCPSGSSSYVVISLTLSTVFLSFFRSEPRLPGFGLLAVARLE